MSFGASGRRPGAVCRIALFIAIWVSGSGLACGSDTGPAPPPPDGSRTLGDLARDAGEDSEAASSSYAREYFRVLGWLSLVVGLAVGTLFALKRVYPGATPTGNPRFVEVIARRALSPKQQIVVVRVGERGWILGVSPDRIDTIGELGNPGELIPLSTPKSFSEELSERDSTYGDDDQEERPDLGPYQREIDRLKKMVGNWRLSMAREGSG